MALQLQYIFTGKRVWSRKIDGQAQIQRIIIGIEKRAIVGISGLRYKPDNLFCYARGQLS